MSFNTPDDWTPEQEALFARLYRHMEANQKVFTHPGAPLVLAEHWQTTAWNAAWLAAVMLKPDCKPLEHVEGEDGETLAVEILPGAMN